MDKISEYDLKIFDFSNKLMEPVMTLTLTLAWDRLSVCLGSPTLYEEEHNKFAPVRTGLPSHITNNFLINHASIYFSNLIVFVRNSEHRFTIFEIHDVHHIILCHSFVSILCLVLFNDLQNMTEVHQEQMADES